MPNRYRPRRRPEQPSDVMKIVDCWSTPAALRLQWQDDEEWSDEKPDRELRLRRMIEPERVLFRVRIPPGHEGVVVVALCSDCGARYIKPGIVPAEDVEHLVDMMCRDEILAWLDEPTSRFFRHITERFYGAKCLRCEVERP